MKQEFVDEQLNILVTLEFLESLKEIVKLRGWSDDYVVTSGLVEELYRIKGIEFKMDEPYNIE